MKFLLSVVFLVAVTVGEIVASDDGSFNIVDGLASAVDSLVENVAGATVNQLGDTLTSIIGSAVAHVDANAIYPLHFMYVSMNDVFTQVNTTIGLIAATQSSIQGTVDVALDSVEIALATVLVTIASTNATILENAGSVQGLSDALNTDILQVGATVQTLIAAIITFIQDVPELTTQNAALLVQIVQTVNNVVSVVFATVETLLQGLLSDLSSSQFTFVAALQTDLPALMNILNTINSSLTSSVSDIKQGVLGTLVGTEEFVASTVYGLLYGSSSLLTDLTSSVLGLTSLVSDLVQPNSAYDSLSVVISNTVEIGNTVQHIYNKLKSITLIY